MHMLSENQGCIVAIVLWLASTIGTVTLHQGPIQPAFAWKDWHKDDDVNEVLILAYKFLGQNF